MVVIKKSEDYYFKIVIFILYKKIPQIDNTAKDPSAAKNSDFTFQPETLKHR